MAPIYCVAGDCATEDYAKAEALAELLMSSLPKAECSLLPQLPADWEAFGAAKARALGVPLSQPLVWTGAGAPVGGLAEFEAECARKYNLHLQSMPTSAWTKIARETLAHQKLLKYTMSDQNDPLKLEINNAEIGKPKRELGALSPPRR